VIADSLMAGTFTSTQGRQPCVLRGGAGLRLLLRPQFRRQRAGGHDVAEQRADLLALTFDRAPHGQDLLADVPGGVTGPVRHRGRRLATFRAESGTWRLHSAAAGARSRQLRATMQTETRAVRILVPAPRAPHRDHPQPTGIDDVLGPALAGAFARASPVSARAFKAARTRRQPPTGCDQNSSRLPSR